MCVCVCVCVCDTRPNTSANQNFMYLHGYRAENTCLMIKFPRKKKKKMERWINHTRTKSLVAIFHSLRNLE